VAVPLVPTGLSPAIFAFARSNFDDAGAAAAVAPTAGAPGAGVKKSARR
jgi:hypothetical protein